MAVCTPAARQAPIGLPRAIEFGESETSVCFLAEAVILGCGEYVCSLQHLHGTSLRIDSQKLLKFRRFTRLGQNWGAGGVEANHHG